MSKSSFPGGLRGNPGIETEALAHLLGHYDAYEPFLQSCRDARLELESPLTSPAKQQVLESLDPAAAEKVGERLLIRLVERQIIESLAKRWNLDRISEVQDSLHWNFTDGVAHIGDPMGTQIRRPFTFFGGMNLVPWDFTVSFAGRYWIWSVTSTRAFKDFRCGVMRDLGVTRSRSLPSELRERFRELAKEASILGATSPTLHLLLIATLTGSSYACALSPSGPSRFLRSRNANRRTSATWTEASTW